MEETRRLLSGSDVLAEREMIETALANLIAAVDWFEWANQLTIDPQRVEAEFDRYDESFDSATTQRESSSV